jgi:hypothetical protein
MKVDLLGLSMVVVLKDSIEKFPRGCGSNSGFFAQAQRSYSMTVSVSSGSLSHASTITLTVE